LGMYNSLVMFHGLLVYPVVTVICGDVSKTVFVKITHTQDDCEEVMWCSVLERQEV